MYGAGHRSESSVKSYCDRQSLEKYKESSNILAKFGDDTVHEESTSALAVNDNNSMQLTQNSQSNVHNVLTNLTNSPTLNFLANAEFKDCQININIMKNKSP